MRFLDTCFLGDKREINAHVLDADDRGIKIEGVLVIVVRDKTRFSYLKDIAGAKCGFHVAQSYHFLLCRKRAFSRLFLTFLELSTLGKDAKYHTWTRDYKLLNFAKLSYPHFYPQFYLVNGPTFYIDKKSSFLSFEKPNELKIYVI